MNHLRSFLFFICTLLSHSAFSQWTQCNGPYGAYISGVASTGNRVLACSKTGQVFLSTDSGSTWIKNHEPSSFNYNYGSVYAKGEIAILLDGGNSAYLSQDSGSSWNIISGLSNLYFSNGHIANTGIYLNTGSRIYRSFDSGNFWTASDSGLPTPVSIQFIRSFGDTLYSAIISSNTLGVAVSFDFGEHWSCHYSQSNSYIYDMVADSLGVLMANTNGLIRFDLSTLSFTNIPMNGWVQAITKIDSEYYFLLSSRLCRSTDLIVTQEIDSGFITIASYLPTKCNTRFVVGNFRDGIYVSDDATVSWQQSNTGLNTADINDICDIDTAILVGSINSGMSSSSNNGSTWYDTENGISKPTITAVAQIDSVLIATNLEHIYRSTNNGQSWSEVYSFANGGYPFRIHTYRDRFIVDIEDDLIISSDNGQNWRRIGNPSHILPAGLAFHGDSIFVSSPWDTIYAKNMDSLVWGKILNTQRILYVGQNDSAWFAAISGDLYRSNDFGSSWNMVVPDMGYYLKIFFKNNLAVFASDSLVYYSTDYGNSFAISDGPRTHTPITSVLLKDSTLYVGTYDLGIWKTDLTLINSIPSQQEVISQIYPNPTSGLINVTLGHSQERVVVKNITGQICPSGIVSQGANLTTMDLSQNPAGMYFLTVEGGLNSRVYRVVLTK